MRNIRNDFRYFFSFHFMKTGLKKLYLQALKKGE